MNSTLDSLTARAHSTPDAPAVMAPGQPRLSFAALLQQVRYCGRVLYHLGHKPDATVALVLPNGPLMATAFLGIHTHTTCAPLNPGFRADEFDYYLADLHADALVVMDNDAAREAASARNIPVLDLQPMATAAGQFELAGYTHSDLGDAPATPCTDAHTGLVLHTSGTTSRPKLVPLSHANLAASARNVANSLALSADDRGLNVMPLFHIHGLVAGLLAPLDRGGSVICTPGFDSARFHDTWLPEQHPTWYTAVPTMHQAILEAQPTPPSHSLRLIRSSSASLAPTVKDALEARFGVPVIEAYGMTEAAHQMTSNPMPPAPRKAGSVGRAAGPEVAVMDEQSATLLAAGEVGEVVIRGANVTAGYVERPEANAAAFVDGFFRTGDQGYFDDEGYLFLTGRLKEIINRGGEKVSPREIDEAALKIDGITQAVAFAVPHAALGEDLALAVVTSSAQLTAVAIRHRLFESLANHKVPSHVLLVDTIPKGATGKLQRLKLAELLAKELEPRGEPAANGLQELVLEAFRETLSEPHLGLHDNFFLQGGDSLSGIRAMHILESRFAIPFSGADLFRYPDAAQFAELVQLKLLEQDPSLAPLVEALASLSRDELSELLADGAQR